eukprot:scaffold116_cov233-Pinguiococcus_pyrenoidosus.AAC.3
MVLLRSLAVRRQLPLICHPLLRHRDLLVEHRDRHRRRCRRLRGRRRRRRRERHAVHAKVGASEDEAPTIGGVGGHHRAVLVERATGRYIGELEVAVAVEASRHPAAAVAIDLSKPAQSAAPRAVVGREVHARASRGADRGGRSSRRALGGGTEAPSAREGHIILVGPSHRPSHVFCAFDGGGHSLVDGLEVGELPHDQHVDRRREVAAVGHQLRPGVVDLLQGVDVEERPTWRQWRHGVFSATTTAQLFGAGATIDDEEESPERGRRWHGRHRRRRRGRWRRAFTRRFAWFVTRRCAGHHASRRVGAGQRRRARRRRSTTRGHHRRRHRGHRRGRSREAFESGVSQEQPGGALVVRHDDLSGFSEEATLGDVVSVEVALSVKVPQRARVVAV